MSKIIEKIEKNEMRKDAAFVHVGDTVNVSKVIVEGKKKRIQKFEGIVIKKQGRLSRESITVRKIVDKIGVEKSYLIHSPLVPSLTVVKKGKVRRARLHYLRDRIGTSATRVKLRT
jgi:large subunit ribosomal protein L19